MSVRLLALAVFALLVGAGCSETSKVQCVVRIYRPDGALHREYRGAVTTWDGGLPAVHNASGGAAYVVLNDRVVDAAEGWQIEVEKEGEVVE